MNADEFCNAGKQLVDFVADYLENIRDYPTVSPVHPGYLKELVPDHAPEEARSWEEVFEDFNKAIMPGITNFNNPNFHSLFPMTNSYPSILAEILSNGLACLSISWSASPACTELEVAVMDWSGKMLQLPEEFLSGGKGGGVIQGSASESTLVALLAARERIISKQKKENLEMEDHDVMKKLVAYTSDEAHGCAERATHIGAVKCHFIESDPDGCMRGEALDKAIQEDKEKGLIPFYVVATLGTTATCAFDKLLEIGPICSREDCWLHIDAAYAGSAFICPEFRSYLDGVEFADSLTFNPHKWLLMNFECSAMWFKDVSYVVQAFSYPNAPVYLKDADGHNFPQFKDWQIPLSRRFRALKMWFVLQLFGVKKLQEHIRKTVQLAADFENLVLDDPMFEVTHKRILGLVCFNLKGQSKEANEKLVKMIQQDGRICLVPGTSKGQFFIRYCICAARTNEDDVKFSWKVIKENAAKILDINKRIPTSVLPASGSRLPTTG